MESKFIDFFIKYINFIEDSDLYNLFSPYGTVISARIMTDKKEGKSRGFGKIISKNDKDYIF